MVTNIRTINMSDPFPRKWEKNNWQGALFWNQFQYIKEPVKRILTNTLPGREKEQRFLNVRSIENVTRNKMKVPFELYKSETNPIKQKIPSDFKSAFCVTEQTHPRAASLLMWPRNCDFAHLIAFCLGAEDSAGGSAGIVGRSFLLLRRSQQAFSSEESGLSSGKEMFITRLCLETDHFLRSFSWYVQRRLL